MNRYPSDPCENSSAPKAPRSSKCPANVLRQCRCDTRNWMPRPAGSFCRAFDRRIPRVSFPTGIAEFDAGAGHRKPKRGKQEIAEGDGGAQAIGAKGEAGDVI